jgi:hypothetical protein
MAAPHAAGDDHRMRALALTGIGVAVLLGVRVPYAAAQADAGDTAVVQPERLAGEVAVQDIRVGADRVSGVLVNRSGRLLRDVRLRIRHQFLWNRERHPGRDDPSRVTYATIAGEIPPGGRMPFETPLDAPLPARADGRFRTWVEVAELTAFPAEGATSGVGAPAPATPGAERMPPAREPGAP